MSRARQLGRAVVRYVITVSLACILGIAGLEGFSPTPYQDQVGVWTNGYGNTHGVGPNTSPVSKEKALKDLEAHVAVFTKDVLTAIDSYPITQGMLDAFVSLTYNIGPGAFRSSTVVKDFKAGRYMDACLRILRFDKAGGKTVRGLALRRYTEYNTCIAGVPNAFQTRQ